MRNKKVKELRRIHKAALANLPEVPTYGETNVHFKDFVVGINSDGTERKITLRLSTILNPRQNLWRQFKKDGVVS